MEAEGTAPAALPSPKVAPGLQRKVRRVCLLKSFFVSLQTPPASQAPKPLSKWSTVLKTHSAAASGPAAPDPQPVEADAKTLPAPSAKHSADASSTPLPVLEEQVLSCCLPSSPERF
jgi:hypothetical protein